MRPPRPPPKRPPTREAQIALRLGSGLVALACGVGLIAVGVHNFGTYANPAGHKQVGGCIFLIFGGAACCAIGLTVLLALLPSRPRRRYRRR